MRRKVLHRVVAYGLLGLVVNVLVAWGLAAWGPVGEAKQKLGPSADGRRPGPRLHWPVAVPEGFSERPTSQVVAEGAGVRAMLNLDFRPPGPVSSVRTVECGWPVRSMIWAEVEERHVDAKEIKRAYRPWVELPRAWPVIDMKWFPSMPRRLPLTPMARGTAANTALYGGAAWAIVMMGAMARRRVRAWRGRCPRCGYELHGKLDAGCPECGWGREALGNRD